MTDFLGGGTALVTGSGSGIGRATALAFARDGCSNLVLGDLSVEGMEETRGEVAEGYPGVAVFIQRLDVAEEASIESFYSAAIAQFGRIDFVANVAGYAHPAKPVNELTLDHYERSYMVNIRGIFMSERAALKQMLKQDPLPGFEQRGSIVNVGSLCSTIAIPGLSVYSGTKGAVLGFTKTDALDFGPHKIRINMVAPGNTITPMLTRTMGKEHIDHFSANTPLRRLGNPADIANVIVFLSSQRAAYITGINVPVDGGMNLATGPP